MFILAIILLDLTWLLYTHHERVAAEIAHKARPVVCVSARVRPQQLFRFIFLVADVALEVLALDVRAFVILQRVF